VVRPIVYETTALGAAYLAGLAIGFWADTDSLQQQWQVDQVFEPSIENQKRTDLINGWKRAVHATIAWANHS
jgi:glycerol kinase